jgi:hypothetical protein
MNIIRENFKTVQRKAMENLLTPFISTLEASGTISTKVKVSS